MEYGLTEAIREQRLISQGQELLALNEVTERYGLSLTNEQAIALTRERDAALRSAGRVALGKSALPKIVFAFCDSAYMSKDNYAQTLSELSEAFYLLKNDSEDMVSDDELIEGMRYVFENIAHGSVSDLLSLSPSEILTVTSDSRYGAALNNKECE